MTQDASDPDKAAANQSSAEGTQSFNAAQGDIGDYLSNVNSAIAAGNPYESKDYLTQQNLATSGAMHSEDDAAKEALQRTAASSGTNTAALANEEAETARAGQRDLTNYNATRDTQNEQAWQGERQGLLQDQNAGAQDEAGLYGTATSGRDSALSSLTSADDAENAMWSGLAGKAIGAGGSILGAYLQGGGGGGGGGNG
jgi:hypothetical protein